MASKRTGIMLAHKLTNQLDKWPTTFITQPKYNGIRCLAKKDVAGNFTLHTSQDNRITSMPHIVAQLRTVMSMMPDKFVLDGELYKHGMPFQEIASRVKRTKNIHPDHKDITYVIFDVKSNGDQTERLMILDRINEFIEDQPTHISISPYDTCTAADLHKQMNNMISMGYEGIIMRHPDGLYEEKKSKYLLKLKPRLTGRFKIIAKYEEFDKNGRPKDTLGGITLELTGDNGIWGNSDKTKHRHTKKKTCHVGTGPMLTKQGRYDLWHNKHILGKIAVVKYQELSTAGRLIFPVLVGIED